MILEKFWNKAIEYYCTNSEHEIVFITVSESLLEEIYQNYLDSSEITTIDRHCIEKNIENCSGVTVSYYISLRKLHRELNKPVEYSFLRFSIFTVVGFDEKEVKRDDNSYWNAFDEFIGHKRLAPLPSNLRTDYIQNIINNLSKYCSKKDKSFFNFNVYGENSNRVNVGRIQAHYLFQNKSIEKIKKSIYKIGFKDTPIEFYTTNHLKQVLEDTKLTRITNIFNSSEEAKELIHECLKMWLNNWIPFEEEQIKLTNSNQSNNSKAFYNLYRLWVLNDENIFEWKYGFILNNRIGNEGKIYSSNNPDVYIDLDYSFKIKEYQFLYVIENYEANYILKFNKENLSFEIPKFNNNKKEFLLRKISSDFNYPIYFFQNDKSRIGITDEQMFIASIDEINELNNSSTFVGKFNSSMSQINLYRIRNGFKNNNFEIIKLNRDINPIFSGISDGEIGTKSFLDSFPIKVHFGNIENGIIEITNDVDDLIYTIYISDGLSSSVELSQLVIGKYKLKIKSDNNYVSFDRNSLRDFIPFTIVENGKKDDRIGITFNSDINFSNQEFNGQFKLGTLNPNFNILDNEDNNNFPNCLSHNLFDFYFTKSKWNEWIIEMKKENIFALVFENVDDIILKQKRSLNYQAENVYLDSEKNQYQFKTNCLFDANISLRINNEMYVSNYLLGKEVILRCFSFELTEFDDTLKEKYKMIEKGDKIFIITNFTNQNKPEILIKYITQQMFPFKINKNVYN